MQRNKPCYKNHSQPSKLTCAYELQPLTEAIEIIPCTLETYLRIRIATGYRRLYDRGSALETYLRIRIATAETIDRGFGGGLETYLRIRIATVTYTVPYKDAISKLTCAYELQRSTIFHLAHFSSRNLPAHTNCNSLRLVTSAERKTRNLPAHTNCNGQACAKSTCREPRNLPAHTNCNCKIAK